MSNLRKDNKPGTINIAQKTGEGGIKAYHSQLQMRRTLRGQDFQLHWGVHRRAGSAD